MSLKRSRSSSTGTDSLITTSSERDFDATADPSEGGNRVRPSQNASKRRKISPSAVSGGSGAVQSFPAHSSARSSYIAASDGDRNSDRLSALSDELLIRILHLLPIECVLICQSVSRRFHRLAGDAQVWKGLYWARWVRPRVRMLPGERERELADFSSRRSKWLDEGRLLRTGLDRGRASASQKTGGIQREEIGDGRVGRPGHMAEGTDWKARYKLRHNWSIGAAEVRKIDLGLGLDPSYDEVEDEMGEDSNKGKNILMARLMDDGVVTVDVAEGLRAWDLKRMECFAQCTLAEPNHDNFGLESVPTCLCVDSGPNDEPDTTIVVGFQDGHFEIWKLRSDIDEGKGTFSRQYRINALRAGERGLDQDVYLSAVAYTHPHLLTITADHVLALYVFDKEETAGNEPLSTSSMTNEFKSLESLQLESHTDFEQRPTNSKHTAPRLLTSLKSHTCWPPLCLSIRSTPQTVIASIAYTLPTYLNGWSVGLQELHLTRSGTILRSRLASAIEQGFQSLLSTSAPSTPSLSQSLRPTTPEAGDHPGRSRSRSGRQTHPKSLSYSHPYLLAGNRDNTLSLYLVTSNNDELKISKSTTLWGHTSSISGAHVGGRGKAVSISAKGDELRVWELEGGLGRKVVQERSVLVRRDTSSSEDVKGKDAGRRGTELENMTQRSHNGQKTGWVGFNDEVVIVLKENGEEGQALVVYDFT